jgi:hypothetical protein
MWLSCGDFPALKGLKMTPQFMREEAARFRGMADTVDREASKLRLLAMAVDYEARAKAADQLTELGPTEPGPSEAVKVKAGKKIAKDLNEAV